MPFQNTLLKPVHFEGIGLHSGERVNLRIEPAEADTGIVFVRTDCNDAHIQASALLVSATELCTVISDHGVQVATVEHLLATFHGLGIDNARVLLDAAEVPITDGSAAAFVDLLEEVGLQRLNAKRRYLRLLKAVDLIQGDKSFCASPHHQLELDISIDFDHPAFSAETSRLKIEMNPEQFREKISRARTFGFIRDVEQLRQKKLALGGHMGNAIVMGEHEVLNPEGLRFDNEFISHKILDIMGDIYLLGHPLFASIRAHKSGHAINNQWARKLLAQTDAWTIST